MSSSTSALTPFHAKLLGYCGGAGDWLGDSWFRPLRPIRSRSAFISALVRHFFNRTPYFFRIMLCLVLNMFADVPPPHAAGWDPLLPRRPEICRRIVFRRRANLRFEPLADPMTGVCTPRRHSDWRAYRKIGQGGWPAAYSSYLVWQNAMMASLYPVLPEFHWCAHSLVSSEDWTVPRTHYGHHACGSIRNDMRA